MKWVYTVWMFLILVGCANLPEKPKPEFDHALLFVPSTKIELAMLEHGFHLADKLSTPHENQGTRGTYFLFLNTYLELLYLEDAAKAQQNRVNFGSDYVLRWDSNSTPNPFSLGIALDPFDSNLVQDEYSVYKSADAGNDEYYLMAESNKNLKLPMIYASMPQRTYKPFESVEEINQKVEDSKREDMRHYLSHKNGVRKLTKIIIKTPHLEALQNHPVVGNIQMVHTEKGTKQKFILEFDDHFQGESFTVEDTFDFTVRY